MWRSPVASGIRRGRPRSSAARSVGRRESLGQGCLFVFTFSRNTFPPEIQLIPGEPFAFNGFSGRPQGFLTEDELRSEQGRWIQPGPHRPLHAGQPAAAGACGTSRRSVDHLRVYLSPRAPKEVASRGGYRKTMTRHPTGAAQLEATAASRHHGRLETSGSGNGDLEQVPQLCGFRKDVGVRVGAGR